MTDLMKLTDLEALILTMIGESRGEPIEGQVAVGSVIINRSKQYQDSVLNVCLHPKQFSCWNVSDPNRILLEELAGEMISGGDISISHPEYRQICWLANGLVIRAVNDNTHGSMHYMTSSLFSSSKRPDWANNITFTKIIGLQTFFNIPGE